MFELFLEVFSRTAGALLTVSSVWLAIETAIDIRRSRRLILYQVVHLVCAGSALFLGYWCCTRSFG